MADTILRTHGTTLDDFLTQQREAGATYEGIARELYALTERTVSVSAKTVQRWLIDFDLLEVAS